MPVVNTYAVIGAGFSDGALALTKDVLGPNFSNAPTPGTPDPFAGTVMFVDPAAANAVLNIGGGAGPSPLSGFVNAVSMGWAGSSLKCDTAQPVRCRPNGNPLLARNAG